MAQETPADKAIRILSLAVSCPVPMHQVKEDDGRFVTTERIVSEYAGSDSEFVVRDHSRGIMVTHALTGPSQTIDESETDVEERAKMRDIGKVWVDKDKVNIECKAGQDCIDVTHSRRGRHQSSGTSMNMCDNDTAENAKFALDYLIQASRTASLQTPGADRSSAVIANVSIRDNRDVDGADIGTLRNVDLERCASVCVGNGNCQAFTYDKWNAMCFLKTAVSAIRLNPKSLSGFRKDVSIPDTVSDQAQMFSYRGKVFPGDGTKNIDAPSSEACAAACKDSLACVAFTYFRDAQKCRFFSTAEAYTGNASTDSGVKMQPRQ